MSLPKRLMIVAFIILMIAAQAQAQLGVRTGLKLGRTQSEFASDDFDDFSKLKANSGGVTLEIGLLAFAIQGDLLYQSRGAVWEGGEETKLHYISIPVVLKKRFLPMLIHPYILAGPEWNYLISGDIDGDEIKSDVKKASMAAVAGIGVEFNLLGKAAFIEARYHYGLTSIADIKDIDIKNRTASVYIGILL